MPNGLGDSRKVNASLYKVKRTETVTVAVAADDRKPLATASVDGGPTNENGTASSRSFSFNVTKPDNQKHNLVVTCDFAPNADDSVVYKFTVKISGGHEFADVIRVDKASANKSPQFRFLVFS